MKTNMNRLILTTLPFIVTSCCLFNNFQQPNINETQIKLDIEDSIVTGQNSLTKLKINLLNNSNSTIAILNINNFEMGWYAIVFYKDSIRYDNQILFEQRIPTKDDYLEVEPQSEINLTFDFDISNYASEEFMFRGRNIDYGDYKLEILYEDKFLIHCNAISSPIQSNKINFTYNKN